MTRGFPNLFVMPAPAQQAVVTVNYTHLAVLGAEFVGRAVGLLEQQGVRSFEVSAEAEDAWVAEDRRLVRRRQPRHVRLHAVAHQQRGQARRNPRNGNYGRGFGDYFGYRELLEQWLDAGGLRGPGARRCTVDGVVSGAISGRRSSTGGGGGIGAAVAEELGPRPAGSS